jgi:hypothetical protein
MEEDGEDAVELSDECLGKTDPESPNHPHPFFPTIPFCSSSPSFSFPSTFSPFPLSQKQSDIIKNSPAAFQNQDQYRFPAN